MPPPTARVRLSHAPAGLLTDARMPDPSLASPGSARTAIRAALNAGAEPMPPQPARHHRPRMEAVEQQFATLRSLLPSPPNPSGGTLEALRHAATYAWFPAPTAAVVTAAHSIPDTPSPRPSGQIASRRKRDAG